MKKRMMHWLAGAACGVALVIGLAFGGGNPPVAHGEWSTPTPTATPTPPHTDGNPGGGGGSGGGG